MIDAVLKGPTYSLASCVVETAHRLIATGSDQEDYEKLRRAGRALLAAEVISFTKLEDMSLKKKYGQGLELHLGFYDQSCVDAVEAVESRVREEVGFSVGGWPLGIQLSLQVIENDGPWISAAFQWPGDRPINHLDLFDGPIDKGDRIQDLGVLQVLGRRLRYRFGVDHADGNPGCFWWTTPQTEDWIARLMAGQEATINRDIRRSFNRTVSTLVYGCYKLPFDYDPLYNTPDDWGFVDLEHDPVTVQIVGPKSSAETHSDVLKTLKMAGNQLKMQKRRVSISNNDVSDPLEPYADYLEKLAQHPPARREVDILLVYRGGGLFRDGRTTLTQAGCERLLDAAHRLVLSGIEVVFGVGHGTTSIHDTAKRRPEVGVFEAVTPTAAANWVLKEHVNHRLMRLKPDPGQ